LLVNKLSVLCPGLLADFIRTDFWINILLSILGWLPGVIHAWCAFDILFLRSANHLVGMSFPGVKVPWGAADMWPTQQDHLQLLPTQSLLPYNFDISCQVDHAIVNVYFLMKDFACHPLHYDTAKLINNQCLVLNKFHPSFHFGISSPWIVLSPFALLPTTFATTVYQTQLQCNNHLQTFQILFSSPTTSVPRVNNHGANAVYQSQSRSYPSVPLLLVRILTIQPVVSLTCPPLGFQEALPRQVKDLAELLGHEWSWVCFCLSKMLL
jgi:hypothetical protein